MATPRGVSFPDIIRAAVRRDGRTLYRLEKDSGVDVAVLQRFMKGERGLNLRTAEKICRAVGLELLPSKPRKGR